MSFATLTRKSESASRAAAPSTKASSGLRIGEPNSALEQEADRIADEVMASPKFNWSLSKMSIGTPPMQRKCDCCESTTCETCGERKTLQRKTVGQTEPSEVPTTVHEVLRSSGKPLDPFTRRFFEPRFGHDFGNIRIHTDSEAAESARSVNALAYTVGRDIVFGKGRYAPQTKEGRGIIAHELTHAVQQEMVRPSLDSLGLAGLDTTSQEREAERVRVAIQSGSETGQIRQRARPAIARLIGSPAGGCGVCYGSPADAGTAAHTEISAAFRTLGFEAPYRQSRDLLKRPPLLPGPGDENFVLDLARPLGPDGIAIGEIKPANPAGLLQGDADLIWYEKQLEKFGFNVSRLMLPPPLAAIPFPTLAPPPCPQFQELFVEPPVHGIYMYWCMPDFSQLVGTCPCTKQKQPPPPLPKPEKVKVKEKNRKKVDEKEKERLPVRIPIPAREVAATLAALGALTFLGTKFKGLVKTRVLAYASAAAALLLIASGAEASIGLEGDDALEALLKHAEAKGQPIPDDIKEALRKDPKLRAALSKAAKTGDFGEAQREAGERLARLLIDHSDEFTEEELDTLLKTTEGVKSSIPNGDVSVEQLKRLIEAKKKGTADGPSTQVSGATASAYPGTVAQGSGVAQAEEQRQPGTTTASPALRQSPEDRLVEGMAGKIAGGPKFTAAAKEKLLAIARAVSPPLTDKEVDDLLSRLVSASGKSEEEIVESLRKSVTTLRSTTGNASAAEEPEVMQAAPEDSAAKVAADNVVKKAKPDKKDARAEAVWEKKFKKSGQIEIGGVRVAGPPGVVFRNGKSFSGYIIGRDKAGGLFFGRGQVTPRLVNGRWQLDVPAGINLMGATGLYGTTQQFSVPAFPGVGTGKKENVRAN